MVRFFTVKALWLMRFPCPNDAVILHSVPKDISPSGTTTNSLFVNIVPPDGNPVTEEYQASVKLGSPSQTCNVKADADPLRCKIENVSPAREFVIQVQGCLPSSNGCGASLEKAFWTTPKGKFFVTLLYVILGLSAKALAKHYI